MLMSGIVRVYVGYWLGEEFGCPSLIEAVLMRGNQQRASTIFSLEGYIKLIYKFDQYSTKYKFLKNEGRHLALPSLNKPLNLNRRLTRVIEQTCVVAKPLCALKAEAKSVTSCTTMLLSFLFSSTSKKEGRKEGTV